MMVNLKWRDACSASRAFGALELAAGWPEAMTISQLAAMQRPHPRGDAEARRACLALGSALKAACKDGSLPHEVTAQVKRTPLVDHVPNRFSSNALWPDAYARDGRPLAYTTGGDEYTVQHQRVRPQDFATWLHAQDEAPSVHIAAWFEARGVAWPPVAGAVSEAPADWEGLVESFKTRKKGRPWSDDERAILRAEFSRRNGWRRADDGATCSRDSGVQEAIAQELGMKRQALDRHLGDGPDHGASAFSSLANAFTGKR